MAEEKEQFSSSINEAENNIVGNESEAPVAGMPSEDVQDHETPGENSNLRTTTENFRPKEDAGGNPLMRSILPNPDTEYNQLSPQNSIEIESLGEEVNDLNLEGALKLEESSIDPIDSQIEDMFTHQRNLGEPQRNGEEEFPGKVSSFQPDLLSNTEGYLDDREEKSANKIASPELDPFPNAEEGLDNREEESTGKVASPQTDLLSNVQEHSENKQESPEEIFSPPPDLPSISIENAEQNEESGEKIDPPQPDLFSNIEEHPENKEESTDNIVSPLPYLPLDAVENLDQEEEFVEKVASPPPDLFSNSEEHPEHKEESAEKVDPPQPDLLSNAEEHPENREESAEKVDPPQPDLLFNTEEHPEIKEEPTEKIVSPSPDLPSDPVERPENEAEATDKIDPPQSDLFSNTEEHPENKEESTDETVSRPQGLPLDAVEHKEESTEKTESLEAGLVSAAEEQPQNKEEPTDGIASPQPDLSSNIEGQQQDELASQDHTSLPADIGRGSITLEDSNRTSLPHPEPSTIEASSTPAEPEVPSPQKSSHLESKTDSDRFPSSSPVPLEPPVHLSVTPSIEMSEEGHPAKVDSDFTSKNSTDDVVSKEPSKDHEADASSQSQGLTSSQEVSGKESDEHNTERASQKKSLNFLSPAPINVPENTTLADLENVHTADMIDVDLDEGSDVVTAKGGRATPGKANRSNSSGRNMEGSTIGNLIARLSPNRKSEDRSSVSLPLSEKDSSAKSNSVPPSLEQEVQSEDFGKTLDSAQVDNTKKAARPALDRAKRLDSAAEINLIANRFKETRQSYQTEDETSRENIEKGQSALKSSFSTFLESLPATPVKPTDKIEESPSTTPDLSLDAQNELHDDELHLLKTDWFFWTQVVNDFGSVAANPEKLEKKIADGIPQQIRGIIWQLIANSKSVEFEDIYNTLRDTTSSHEASIRRDMKRTKFIPENKFENLFNVIKVYSVFDPDVGYTQGMAFIVTPLLLNTETEAEAFGLLVRLMKGYGLRRMYLPEMPGLMVMLYQFDRLLEENSPQLYNHLTRQGVRSSMYATQWFLTFFAYKFPLEFVLRIYDIVFMEGVESFLKFAVNLVLKNIDNLLNLQFDKLLDFLKDELFFYYLKSNVEQRKSDLQHSDGSILKRDIVSIDSSQKQTIAADDEYDVDQFVHDAMNDVYITPISLRRYTSEYDEIHEIEQQKEAQYESMRIKNQQLQKEVRKLENSYTLLNREHVDIANELIKNRLRIETLNDENNDMKNTILELRRQLDEAGRKQTTSSPNNGLPSDIREDLKRTIQRNSEVMNENLKLQDRITELEKLLATLKIQQAVTASANEVPNVVRERSSTSWSGFRKVFKKEEGTPPR